MNRSLSVFGRRLALDSGIGELMQDLGDALASGDPNLCMLGGGQPAHIEAIDEIWQQRLREIADDAELTKSVLGDYQPPGGDAAFRDAVAAFFRRHYDWPIDGENVCITSGGQTAFFLLLNAIAGQFENSTEKKVLLPIVPEYIGYADQSTSAELFRAARPIVTKIDNHEFKYSIDFEALDVDESIAAMCISRPTNPSSNVITDDELRHLCEIAEEKQIPLIVDNAYGVPFPGVVFGPTTPIWNPSMILTYSLSKLGLPGTRTGIVIADKEIVRYLESMNAIASLANNNIGQAIVAPLIKDDRLMTISRDIIQPFYDERSRQAQGWLEEALDDSVPYRVHQRGGAFFLWVWFEGLPISSKELYSRLKERGVLIISGHYFFFGLESDDWAHRQECIRVSFTTSESVLRRGLKILADEINRLYA